MKKSVVITLCCFILPILFFAFKAVGLPNSIADVVIGILMVLPYFHLLLLVDITTNVNTLKFLYFLTVIIGCLSTWAFIDTLYINIDPQGALVLVFVPIWQLVFLAIVSLPVVFYRKEKVRA